MDMQTFQGWLRRYGEAWIAGDPDAVVTLFGADAAYYETPYDPPMIGTEAIRRYWTEGAKDAQTDITFAATPVFFDTNTGYARWQATFRRVPSNVHVELDGMLAAQFDAHMRCTEFREWWHRRETPPSKSA